jgi:hypothetical protein
MFGLWLFGIFLIVVYGSFCKVKHDINIFNAIVVLCSIFWLIVLPLLCIWFLFTLFWDSLQLIMKRIIKRTEPIDSLTEKSIVFIKGIVFDYDDY